MVFYRCDRCGKEDEDFSNMHTVQATDDGRLLRYDLCKDCLDKLLHWFDDNDGPGERDCRNCKHLTDTVHNGLLTKTCSQWECHFERRTE